jgi:quercetin dioxygenase-like cupin family protein
MGREHLQRHDLDRGIEQLTRTSMSPTRFLFAIAGIIVVFASGFAAGQRRQPPTADVGRSEEVLRSLDLTGELDSGKGRLLRMRRITLQPGGVLAVHNHVDRPAVTYLLQGQMTYHQEGRPPVVVNPGEGFAEGRATTHWGESTGTVPAVWLGIDIPRP